MVKTTSNSRSFHRDLGRYCFNHWLSDPPCLYCGYFSHDSRDNYSSRTSWVLHLFAKRWLGVLRIHCRGGHCYSAQWPWFILGRQFIGYQPNCWALRPSHRCGLRSVSFGALLATTNDDSYGIAFHSCSFVDSPASFSPSFVLESQECGSTRSDLHHERASTKSTTPPGKRALKRIARKLKTFVSRLRT